MTLSDRLNAFSALGLFLEKSVTLDFEANTEEIQTLCFSAKAKNAWFLPQNTLIMLKSISKMLEKDNLQTWIDKYNFPEIQENSEQKPKKIGVVMAGNIPAVGFHDALCVLLSGHILHAKLSSDDQLIIPFLLKKLISFLPEIKKNIHFVERMNEVDAIIATGSDNTARYFEYYFAKKPHIIRKNRHSVAIFNGKETKEDFLKLGEDIFTYFGLGCRNVAKLYVPKDYEKNDGFVPFYDTIQVFEDVYIHNKYANNYDYNKAIYLIKKIPHYDNNFLIISESTEIASPIAMLFYEFYDNEAHLAEIIRKNEEKIQCIVSKDAFFKLDNEKLENSFGFGQAQQPRLHDYADGVDTMAFLKDL